MPRWTSFCQVLERRVGRNLVVPRQTVERLVVIGRGQVGPGRYRAFAQRQLGVGDHQLGVEIELHAEPVAGRAGAERVVEREQPRLDLVDGEAGDRAGELGREHGALAGVGVLGDGRCPRPAPALSRSVREAVAEVRPHDEAVDHHLDVVLELLVEGGGGVDLVQLAVDLDALEAALLQVLQLLAVLALAAADDRRQQVAAACLPAWPVRGRPSATRSGFRSAGRWRANRARRCARTAGAGSRKSR